MYLINVADCNLVSDCNLLLQFHTTRIHLSLAYNCTVVMGGYLSRRWSYSAPKRHGSVHVLRFRDSKRRSAGTGQRHRCTPGVDHRGWSMCLSANKISGGSRLWSNFLAGGFCSTGALVSLGSNAWITLYPGVHACQPPCPPQRPGLCSSPWTP